MSEIKLLPCPFCGGAVQVCEFVGNRENGRVIYAAVCSKCRSRTRNFFSPANAVSVWNGWVADFSGKKTLPND